MPDTSFAGSSTIADYLEELRSRFANLNDGKVADYIPELAKADPTAFGICIATTDGRVYEAGDTRRPFTIQSMSKPFVYGLALDTHGEDAVLRKVGVEPSGEAFNSISLEPGTGRPLNPMINAGAIATTSLVPGSTPRERLGALVGTFERYVGHPLGINQRVFESERDTGHRNRAIGHMLRNFGILEDDPEPTLELYFKQCSIDVDCRDLSLIAATLAAGGRNPLTGERALSSQNVAKVLSVMTFAGLYDFAGSWGYRVGLPAKSGVGGGILAVLPGQLGIGVFSPPLDARGNSVRGIRVCEELSRLFNLHFLDVPQTTQSAIRVRYDASRVSSKRRRPPRLQGFLREHGSRIGVYELQGHLRFSTAEVVVAELEHSLDQLDYVVLDLKHVLDVDPTTIELLGRLLARLRDGGKRVLLSNAERFSELLSALAPATGEAEAVLSFRECDLALEWCENTVAAEHGFQLGSTARSPVSEVDLLFGVSAEDCDHLQSLLISRQFAAGARIIARGESADRIFLLVKGEASVTTETGSGRRTRIATLSPGMAFGELSVVDQGPRSADVHADGEVVCLALEVADFQRLGVTHPRLQAQLLTNLLRSVAQVSRRLTSEVAARSE